MRHNPAAGAVVIMLRTLKMHGMAQAVGELTEQGSPAFEAAVPILSQLLKAETADREVRSTAYQLKAARFPNYRDLAGFDFASSEVNEALVRQLIAASFWKTPTMSSWSAARAQTASCSPSAMPLKVQGSLWLVFQDGSPLCQSTYFVAEPPGPPPRAQTQRLRMAQKPPFAGFGSQAKRLRRSGDERSQDLWFNFRDLCRPFVKRTDLSSLGTFAPSR